MVGDFLAEEAPERLKTALGGPADVVLSDMAAHATGHAKTYHLKVMALVEAAHLFAREVLAPGGAFVAKVLQGGTERDLLAALRSEEHTSELQSLMRIAYAVFGLKKKKQTM